jgi:DNA/RNA-binding protein KIN17
MERFSTNSKTYIENFSREFERSYLDVLSHNHHTKRVNANYVYNELIQDRSHVHMNATRWDSLASFVKYLGETGRCEVDETERGWFVRWIDPEERKRDVLRRKRDEDDARVQERRTVNLLKRQKEMGSSMGPGKDEEVVEEEEDERPIESTIVVGAPVARPKPSVRSALFLPAQEQPHQEETQSDPPTAEDTEESPTWLMPDIVVRINSSKAGPGLKNEKAVILDIKDDHADLILLKSGQDLPGVASKSLETVIPRIGGKVMVLGLHALRGMTGILEEVNVGECKARVKLFSGETKEFEFEEISKVFDESNID